MPGRCCLLHLASSWAVTLRHHAHPCAELHGICRLAKGDHELSVLLLALVALAPAQAGAYALSAVCQRCHGRYRVGILRTIPL